MNYFIVVTGNNSKQIAEEVAENFGVKRNHIYNDESFEKYGNANKWIGIAYDIIKKTPNILLITKNAETFELLFNYLHLSQSEDCERRRFNILFTDEDSNHFNKLFEEVYIY